MNKIETEDIKELFAEWGLWSLIDDVSPDGDGHGDNLQLTKEGLEAERMINLLLSDQSQKQPEGDYVNTEPEKVIVDPIGVDFTTEGKNREFPVLSSLYVTATVAVTADVPVAVYHSNHHVTSA